MTKDRRPNRLPAWQELSVYIGLGLLLATGVAWLLLDWFIRIPGEFGPEHHAAEHWALVTHGVLAYVFMVVVGSLIPIHIKLGWSLGRNRTSGSALSGTLLLLSLSALGLYYVADDDARTWINIVHWSLGLLAPIAILSHVLRAHR